jgi:hypothetical protein
MHMKNILFLLLIIGLCMSGCTKGGADVTGRDAALPKGADFTPYTIKKGQHFTDSNPYQPVDVTELKFAVQFDSSAIYQSILPENQYDINKLYGFADNNSQHQQFSARFGWRWSEGALRLFAYVYNDGTVTSQELGPVRIGIPIICSIKVTGNVYLFSVDEREVRLPRTSTTSTGKGYQLYPYFGGDEVAPHDITILIKNL